jgi:hypothetical protein
MIARANRTFVSRDRPVGELTARRSQVRGHARVLRRSLALGRWFVVGHARIAHAVALGGVAFLYAYAALHLLHVAEREPALMQQISLIPLARTFITSSLGAVVVGVLALANLLRAELETLPRHVLIATAVFTLTIVLFP